MHERPTHPGPGDDFLTFANREQLGVFATAIFERVGYFTTPGEGLAVHGIDFIVYKPDGSEPEIALRCRPDLDKTIEGADVARFWEKITSQGYERGIFVTNQVFSPAAFAFAEKRDFILVDQDGLKKGINALPSAHRATVLEKVAAAQEAQPAMVSVRVPDIMPKSAARSPEPDEAVSADSKEEPERKIFRTPSTRVQENDNVISSLEGDELTSVFGAPTARADETNEDFDSWVEEEEETWKSLENSNEKVKSATNLLAILSPVTFCIAVFLLWEPLMGSNKSKSDGIAAPIVADYLRAKESGENFDVVAEIQKSSDADRSAN